PDLEVGYNYCRVTFTTHAVRGLSENDFVCAAKIDLIPLASTGCWGAGIGRFKKQLQPAVPQPASWADPLIKQAQCLRLYAAHALAADLFRMDQSILFKHLKMLKNRGKAKRQMLCEPTHRGLPVAKAL